MKIRCANCGAEIAVERDDAFLVCPFCNSSLYLDRAHTFKNLLLTAGLQEASARDLLQKELALREIPPAPARKVERVLLPYWGVRGESLQETMPAYSPAPAVLQGYRLPSAGAVFYEEGLAGGFEPVACSEAASSRWEGREDVSSFALYRVPFYKISFGGGARAYTAWVEAVAGKVFMDDAPPPMSSEISSHFLKLVVLLFVIFTAIAALVPGFGLSLLAVAVAAAVAFPVLRGLGARELG